MRLLLPRAVLGLGLSLAFTVSAVQFVPLSVAELTAKAQLVLYAKVQAKTCQRDEAGRIYTRVELQVREVWKGPSVANPVIVVHGGGLVGRQRAVVSGQVDYPVGEEVVAFLVLNQRGEGVTLGLAQGKFQVWADPATGEKLVRNLFHGVGPADGQRLQGRNGSGQLTLQALRQQVQGSAKGVAQ